MKKFLAFFIVSAFALSAFGAQAAETRTIGATPPPPAKSEFSGLASLADTADSLNFTHLALADTALNPANEILMPATAPKKAANPRATKKTTAKKAATAKKTTAKKTTAKATAKKTTAKTAAKKQPVKQTNIAKADPTAERGQETQLGLMPSELDTMNHNVLHANAAAIRGAFDTESALRYIPFVTLINTAGFGYNFDLRGQGRLAANGVKLYINGVPSTPLDSYYSAMPINTVLPHLIQEVEVFPGSGAVLYGAGTKGGTVNIITSKRQRPYFLVGGGYINTMATQGNSFNAFAHAAEKFGSFGVNAGLEFTQLGGPREDDSQTNIQGVLGATWDFALGQKVDLDVDFYYGTQSTTPYNSFLDTDKIMDIMRSVSGASGGDWNVGDQARQAQIRGGNGYFEPDKESRANKGEGEIKSNQIRLNAALAYQNEITPNLKVDVNGFYHLNSKKYDTYIINLPYFVLGFYDRDPRAGRSLGSGYAWFAPRPASDVSNNLYEGQRADLHLLDQSGTTITENKFGAKAQVSWKHFNNSEFIFGLEGKYEFSKRDAKNHLRQAMPTIIGNQAGGSPAQTIDNETQVTAMNVNVDSIIDTSALTSAVYIMENLQLGANFSLMGGVRYEMKNYNIKYNDKFDGYKLYHSATNGTNIGTDGWTMKNPYDCSAETGNTNSYRLSCGRLDIQEEVKEDYGNFIAELTPAFRYSNTGAIYLHGEYGYIAPPAWAMVRRLGHIRNQATNSYPLDFDFFYQAQDLKSESYWTAEIGWKEAIGKRQLGFIDISALLFSLNVFYTDSKDEFYYEGDSWVGFTFGNYEKSRRMGAEVAMEQILFNGGLSFNESFTYLKAQRFHCDTVLDPTCEGQWQTMPYTYDYKATFGAAIDVSGYLEIVDVGVGVWIQNSLYGNQTIYTKDMVYNRNTNNSVVYSIVEGDPDKLKPYIISDLGLSINLNKNALTITAGVKNLFDTFYYDYYNSDRSSVVNENRYVVGRGRTVFIEGAYKY